jgi:4-amino-4-deoxy-L-arabinose transferase-like glycosyltransferase
VPGSRPQSHVRSISVHTAAAVVFVLVWLSYGAAMKRSDLKEYNLQQAGIDAIVEHGTLEVGKSEVPRLRPRGDVFRFEGRLLPAKQPGQFVFGAVVYGLLRSLGMSYGRNYVTTAAWVTWLSSSSFAALSSTLLLVLLVAQWGLDWRPSLAAALVLAFGTPLFAYSGVAHHDVISSSLLLAAFVLLEQGRRKDSSAIWAAFGVLCGLVLFVSMLPALMVTTLLAASLVGTSPRRASLVGLGLLVGVLPLAVHNWIYFHSPFVQNYMAGGYTDSLFQPSWSRLRSTGWAYLGFGEVSVWLYAPAAGAGLLLLVRSAWRDPRHRRSAGLILVAVALHLGYILSITTIGDCQFGPRYFMPCLAFAVTGCALQWDRALEPGSPRVERALGLLLLGVALASILIGAAGARSGTMICDLGRWIPARVLSGELRPPRFPLAGVMIPALSVVASGALVLVWRSRRTRRSSPAA